MEQLPPLTAQTADFDGPVARRHEFTTTQAGGLFCSSSNGEAFSRDDTLNPDLVSLSVWLVPGGAAEFPEYLAMYGLDADLGGYCASVQPDSCTVGVLVEDVWVAVDAYGVDPALLEASDGMPAQMREIVDGVRSLVLEAGMSESSWAVPEDTIALTPDCSVFFDAERVKADFAIEEVVYFGLYEDYASVERAARLAAPALSCSWYNDLNDPFGEHSVLFGGQWAFEKLEREGRFSEYDELTLDGLTDVDSALASCKVVEDACIAQAAVGRNWIYFSVGMSQNGLDESSAREKLTGFVQTAADVIRR